MKAIVLAAVLGISFWAHAEETEVASKTKATSSVEVSTPSTFIISNNVGPISLSESTTGKVEVLIDNQANKAVKASVVEVAPGKMKLEVKGPNGGGSVTGVSIGSISGSGMSNVVVGGVRIGNIQGGNISVINGRVFVDGKEVTGDGSGDSGAFIGEVRMEVKVPAKLLQHVQINAVGKITVEGAFQSDLTTERVVNLDTKQGAVILRGMIAMGGIEIKSSQGKLNLEGNVGTVKAKTSQGAINASKNYGDMELRTSQGSVDANENDGNIYAKTSQGSITIRGQRKGTVVGETSMGEIEFNNPEAISEKGKSSMGSVTYTPGKCEDCLGDDKKPKGKGPFNF